MKDKRISIIIMVVLILAAILLNILNFKTLFLLDGMDTQELAHYPREMAVTFSINIISCMAVYFVGLNLSEKHRLKKRFLLFFGPVAAVASALVAIVYWVRCLF